MTSRVHRRRALIVGVFLGAAAVLAALAPVDAQSTVPTQVPTFVDMRVRAPTTPIPPTGVPFEIEGQVTYAVLGGSPTLRPSVVRLQVTDAPAWAHVVVAPSEMAFTPGPTAGPVGAYQTFTGHFTVRVTSLGKAPAFAPGTIWIEAEAEPNFPYSAAFSYENVVVQEGLLAKTVLEPEAREVTIGSRATRDVRVMAANAGNAATRVVLTPVAVPPGFEVTLPDPFFLDSPLVGRGTTATNVTIGLKAPSRFDAEVDVTVRADPVYALDPSIQGPPTLLTLRVRPAPATGFTQLTQEIPHESGTLVPLGMGLAGALAGAGIAFRRVVARRA